MTTIRTFDFLSRVLKADPNHYDPDPGYEFSARTFDDNRNWYEDSIPSGTLDLLSDDYWEATDYDEGFGIAVWNGSEQRWEMTERDAGFNSDIFLIPKGSWASTYFITGGSLTLSFPEGGVSNCSVTLSTVDSNDWTVSPAPSGSGGDYDLSQPFAFDGGYILYIQIIVGSGYSDPGYLTALSLDWTRG
jgi:hypothetical protein